MFVLWYKVVSFFCQYRRNSLTAELIGFSVTVKLVIGPELVSGYFIFLNKSRYGFRLFFCSYIFLKIYEYLDARGGVANCGKVLFVVRSLLGRVSDPH